jgi:hypothetical protein
MGTYVIAVLCGLTLVMVKVKVKVFIKGAIKAQNGSIYLTSALDGGG